MASRIPDEDFVEYLSQRALWLRRTAYALCQDWDQADDLAQIAVTRLYAHWPRAKSIGNLDGYLRRIVVNCFLDETRRPWWRRVISHDAAGLDPVAAREPDLDAALDLREALAALPPRQRATIVLRYYCDLSVEETASVLSCSPGTIKSQTSRGIESLRRKLDVHPVKEQLS
jgi:RNA polymerase sigma-70 factor (sigma-E family)